jgi:hypothetical protein
VGTKKTVSYGSCVFQRANPSREALKPDTKKVNIFISFEEALKLQFAIIERLRAMNGYKRNTIEGRRQAVNLVVDLKRQYISVMPGVLLENE